MEEKTLSTVPGLRVSRFPSLQYGEVDRPSWGYLTGLRVSNEYRGYSEVSWENVGIVEFKQEHIMWTMVDVSNKNGGYT